VEFFLIVGHHAPDPIGVEIPGDLRERIARLGELEQGIFKQVPVIRLKVDLSAGTEHPAV